MSDVRIRDVTPADAAAPTAVSHGASAENREPGLPSSAESATTGAVTDRSREDPVLVATADSEVVGGVRLDATADRGAGLSRPGVRDDRTGAGIGGRLLDAA